MRGPACCRSPLLAGRPVGAAAGPGGGTVPGVVGAAERRVSRVRGLYPFVVLYRARSASAGLLRGLSWRCRRVVVRCRRLVLCLLLACGLAGLVWGESLALWAGGSRLAGNGRLRGQILVRPLLGSGAVRSAAVRLVPVAPAGRLAGLLFVLCASAPEVLAPDVDHAGRWSTVPSGARVELCRGRRGGGLPSAAGVRRGCLLAAGRAGGPPDGIVPPLGRGAGQWISGSSPRSSSTASDVLSLM